MKRKSFALLAALFLLSILCACAQKTDGDTKSGAKAPYTVSYGGVNYTVTPLDENSGTISDSEYTYSYAYKASGSGYSVTFTYPDGESYTWRQDDRVGSGSASLDFDFSKYPDGMELQSVLERETPRSAEKKEKNVGLILLLLVIGVINTAWPKAAWYLEMGWKIKDAEPSEAALGVSRLTGVIALIVAAILILA